MADRTVSVKLVADAQAYIRGVEEAARKTRESSDQIEQRLAAQREAYSEVGVAALAVGTVAAAGVAAAVTAYANFDAAMSNVQAATGESAANMQRLSEAALTAGADTVFSATEAAAAIEELSKAGVSTSDILGGGLTGALDLAAAGQIDVAEAAEVAASAMTQFGLEGGDVTHIADLLAAAAGNAQGGVSDMGAALDQAGLVASQMGLSIEETTGTLASFASAGLLGSDAGTSFRAMLLRLANPTGEVRDVMDELGLSFYDAQGQFIGMEGVAGQLQDRMSGLDQETRNAALATIFGQDAIRAASILYEQGAEGVAEWTATVDDSGYAAEQAAARLDNLQGDLEALGGAFETLLINLGSSADGPLRFLVQSLDDIVSGLANMPEPLQAATIGAAALVAAVGLGAGAFLTIVPQIAATKVALDTLSISAVTARGAMSTMATFLGNPYVVAAAAAVAGLVILNQHMESTRATTSELEAMLRGGASAARLFAEAAPDSLLQFDFDGTSTAEFEDWIDRIANKGENMWAALDPGNIALDTSGFTGALADLDERFGAMDFENASQGFRTLVEDMGLSQDAAARLIDAMPALRDALLNQAEALDLDVTAADGAIDNHALLALAYGDTGDASTEATAAIEEQQAAVQTAAESVQELSAAISALNDVYYSAQDATAGYYQSIDDVTAAINNGLLVATLDASGAIDLTSEAGRNAESLLSGMASSALDSAAAMLQLDGNTEGAYARITDARARFIDAAAAAGINRDQAALLADAYGLTEGAVSDLSAEILAVPDGQASIDVDTAAGQLQLDAFLAANSRRVIQIGAEIATVSGATTPGGVRHGYNGGYDAGGRIPGPYAGGDDRLGFDRYGNVYGLAGSEWIINAKSSSKWDRVLRAINEDTYRGGFDSGGRIGADYQAAVYAAPVVHVAAPSGQAST